MRQHLLAAHVREAFGWDDDVVLTAGPRGALGQIWRVDVGQDRYALKEIFAEPPSEASIAAELSFARRATDAGVRLPASHPDRTGRHLLTAPDGTWLRLYDWVDLRPTCAIPTEIGELLARLHRCAPATTERPSRWYDTVPAAHEWPDLPWVHRLADLSGRCAPTSSAGLLVCHRDLHPDNVLADARGALVVVDWDDLGPAEPAGELARALFDWCCDGTADLDAVARMCSGYLRAGGPGRLTEPADFSMLLACRLNFLLVQTRVVLDPTAEARHREWAAREVEEALRILPTPRQLSDVLAVTRAC